MPLKLEPTTCDPITANLIDLDDVAYYFKLYVYSHQTKESMARPGPNIVYRLNMTPDAGSTMFATHSLGCWIRVSTPPSSSMKHHSPYSRLSVLWGVLFHRGPETGSCTLP